MSLSIKCPLISWPDKKYRVLYADPPWNFKTWSKKGTKKSASNHYPIMTMQDIADLPMTSIAKNNAIMFMWTTDPLLNKQIAIMEGWGFKYKTMGFVWTKTTKNGKPFFGCGYYTRANPEYCVIGVKGKIGRPKNKGLLKSFTDPVREHSRKPDKVYGFIESLYDGPYIELFARTRHPGWDVLGNETDKFEEENTNLFNELM